MRLSKIVVSLPLILCVAQLSQPISLAQAAAMNATQATELLAKSHAIDAKCSVLSADQSQNLRDFVARAEISLAEKASVSIARKTIANGKAQGKVAVCDEAAKKLVNDVLAAANAATVAPIEDQTIAVAPEPAPMPSPQTVVAVEPKPAVIAPKPTALASKAMDAAPKPIVKAVAVVEPVPAPKPLRAAKTAKIEKPATKVKVAKTVKPAKQFRMTKPGQGLQTYAMVAEKYYVATRCGSMSASKINALYKQVLANHQQAMAGNRPRAVRAMLQSVEARAGSKSCG